ncbi:DUF1688 family protein [Roseibium sp.]|uniref:DUF1688 family protein n=1 Tax=Roseibium sp. TaxID=1936156 RepID=UPI003A98649A
MTDTPSHPISLLNGDAVMRSAERFLSLACDGRLQSLTVNLDRLEDVLEVITREISIAYPDNQIPPHSCWRAFEIGGIDRWGMLAGARGFASAEEMLLAAADLAGLCALANVRLKPEWRFVETMTGEVFEGATGRALAVLSMFAAGVFSAQPEDPMRADAHALIRLQADEIAAGFQLDPADDAEDIERLAHLLKRLGEATGLRPDLFERDEQVRPGCMTLFLMQQSGGAEVSVAELLDTVLEGLAVVWEGGLVVDDVILGDTWRLSDARRERQEEVDVPFHLPAIEIASSLVEPFAWAGVAVTDLDRLPGLANLEHVVLFLEAGAICLRDVEGIDPAEAAIELRAVALGLLQECSKRLWQQLNVSPDALPLLCLQEGGTLRAGRKIVMENPALAQKASKILGGGGVFWLPFKA